VSTIVNAILLKIENKKIVPNGTLIEVNGHKLHIYSEGDINNKPTLVFMSGGGTSTPVYDFKPLYSLLKDEYNIIVIEKIGYGYADIVNTNRDIDIILDETRKAIQSVGNNDHFVLLPHSMSGLEALYWQYKYPEEIVAIIGLDMAFPESYDHLNINKEYFMMKLLQYSTKIGLHRIPFVYKVNDKSLTVDEYKQAKYLTYRNALNISFINEIKSVTNNAKKVAAVNDPSKKLNMLLFSSNGIEIGDFWVSVQKELANKLNAEIIIFDCGHYIHYFESEEIAKKIKQYLNKLIG
jgi:pimeloyl-ACP methyl ester carboxylesterase